VHRHSSDVLAPLTVVSSFTVPNAPQFGHDGGTFCELVWLGMVRNYRE
jgi:hypothetical protein